jgi:hypothetical protein
MDFSFFANLFGHKTVEEINTIDRQFPVEVIVQLIALSILNCSI